MGDGTDGFSSARFLSRRISDASPVGVGRQTDPRAENHLNFNTEGERKHFRIHALLYCQCDTCSLRGCNSHVRTARYHDCTFKESLTVHFQFDLLKLETNNTRDDKVKHAWIIARLTVG